MSKRWARAYTTGAFDCLHVGHIRLLRRAKENAEQLIVGVSTDKLIGDYKGKAPIQTLEERMEIVSSVRFVDRVVIQEDREKKTVDCLKLDCDCMVVGDDWKGSELFEKVEVELRKHGVEVLYLPYTKGISTTEYRKYLDMCK